MANFKGFYMKVNWDVPIALRQALIRVGSDAPVIHHPLYQSCSAYRLLRLHTARDVARTDACG
jgi:hypothetical protein